MKTKLSITSLALPLLAVLLSLATVAAAQVTEDKLTASDGAANDFFGFSVSLSGDRALVAAIRDDDLGTDSGSAYVFERQGDGTWLEVAKLTASDGAAVDYFGVSVSLSGDRALVGACCDDDLGDNSGSAYIFTDLPQPIPEPSSFVLAVLALVGVLAFARSRRGATNGRGFMG